MSISDKIRALAAQGLSRKQIADLLDRSYQQVRQVLVEDERRARRRAADPATSARTAVAPVAKAVEAYAEVADVGAEFGGIWRLRLEDEGVVRLPDAVQAALGLKSGRVLICELDGEVFKIFSPRAAAERARSFLKGLPLPEDRSLVDELIAERRAEAAREDRDD